MARVLDPGTGTDVRRCVECGTDMEDEGTRCPNAPDLCIEDCQESH